LDLDVGRLTVKEAMGLGALTIAALFVGTLGGLLAWWAWPEWSWSGPRVAFVLFGSAVGLVGSGFGVLVARLTVEDWLSYRRRLDDWHEAALVAYEATEGRETEQHVTAWELTASHPLHVLAVALAVHQRAQAGDAGAHSVRSLEGAVWLGGVRLGDVGSTQAEQIGRVFSDLRLVRGRGPRQSGEWSAGSADDVVKLLAENWSKVR
jgi:hypothetical protein